MPSCRAIRPGAWQIQLPPTLPLTPHQQATYVATAQRCLLRTPAPSVWVLDLRGNTGGSDEVMLAAAAPLLRSGPVYQWVNAQGETLVVTLGPDGKRTGGVLAQRRALPLNQRHPSRVIAWVDGACGSACEMLAVALQTLPAHLRVGSSTAGLTSANELVPLTDRVQMAITAGWMLDAQGAAVRGPLQPDVPLAVQTAEDLLLSLPK
jgi:C-terminal processing protease CtpA/Prc